MGASRTLDWIGAFEGLDGFRYEISDLLLKSLFQSSPNTDCNCQMLLEWESIIACVLGVNQYVFRGVEPT